MPELYLPARFHIPSRRKFLECELDIKCTLSAKYKIQIVRDGKVIREPFGDKWLPNLIVNQCFDNIFNNAWSIINTMAAVRAGTSATTPTTGDTNLNAPWGGTNTVTGSGASSTNDTINGACTHTVSFDFAAAGAGVTLNEVGLAGSTAANLHTHALFPSAVTLITGDVLRVAYTMTWSIPATVTAVPISLSAINGFNISGNMKVCGTFITIFGALNAAGSWTSNPTNHFLFNAQTAGSGSALVSAPTTFPAVNTSLAAGGNTLGSNVTGSLSTYTNGTFTRNQTFVWIPSNPATTVSNVNGICTSGQNQNTSLYILLSAAQTKANTNTLTVITTCTLARA